MKYLPSVTLRLSMEDVTCLFQSKEMLTKHRQVRCQVKFSIFISTPILGLI